MSDQLLRIKENKTSETVFVKNECFITPFLSTHTLNDLFDLQDDPGPLEVERAISLERKPSELIPKKMQRGLSVITLQGAIEKSPILLSQYWKNE